MNSIRRAITAERKRLLTLSPTSILQEQHASSSTARRTVRPLKSSKSIAPEVRSPEPPHPTTSSSSNDAVLKEPVTWAKPSEIPWQAKVVNSVNLIGRVKIPVQFETSSDGKNWAGTIISQDDGSKSSGSLPSFWIPVIFEGDLAHIATCHLKEKDYVHVSGHLSVDVPPFKLSEVQANVQVMVHSINFVEGFHSNKTFTPYKLDSWTTKNSDAAFEQENQSQILNVAESSKVHNSNEAKTFLSAKKFNKQISRASWRDLLTNSTEWDDNREKKRKGLVKHNYPDFKHKVTGDGLWLDGAPPEVLQGIGHLQFNGAPIKPVKVFDDVPNKAVKDGDSWKQLVQNPSNWWDNRVDKRNQKSPDFKNKDSGKGLWLSDAPEWVLSSLPPPQRKPVGVDTKKGWGF
ncbi:hypothetical protein L1887_12234 [Cichorium endivia]|nr:hypothetical protein L1887_12234 [Cichorium endivia]